ncbi:MAG TPA: 50S ribosomal protein L11 methyltransferase [Vicinamibacterales bacterium]|nr:50S ribosomal protein L11 methyltransferase [Vicinamibacterales bacterium]
MDSARPTRPALDVFAETPAYEPNQLPLIDVVAAIVDDFAPFAIEERGPWSVRVHFTSESNRNAAQAAVTAECDPRVCATPVAVSDDDWASRSQADLRAIRVGRVVVAPPWDMPSMAGDSRHVVVQIRPALGFGSGHHPTTRLALRGLQQLDLRELDVLDLGTGSGVLAIAAVKLGARQATGIDRDPDALASAQDSVEANQVASRVELRDGDISRLQQDAVAVVVANLTGALLTRVAPTVATLVTPGGHIVLSGILAEEEAAVSLAYSAYAEPVWRAVEDEWVGMVWRREHKKSEGRMKPASDFYRSQVAPDVLQHRHGADDDRIGA